MSDPNAIDSTPPAPPPLSPMPPPPSPEHSATGTVLAWIIILLIVGYMFFASLLPGLRGRGTTPQDMTDPQLAITAKYAIGVLSLKVGALGQILGQLPVNQLVAQLDQAARTPVQKVHAAIVAGELLGAEAALNRLNAVEADSPQLSEDIGTVHVIYQDGPNALEPAVRESLAERHGFFGRLALIHGTPENDPARKTLIDECVVVAGAFIAFFLLLLFAGLAGLVLLIVGIVFYFTGSLKPAYAPPVRNSGLYAEMFAVYLLSFAGLSLILAMVMGGRGSFAWSWALSIVVPIAVAWGLLRGLSWTELRLGMGWHTGRGTLIEIPMGVVGYLAGLPVVAGGFLVTYVLIQLSHSLPSHPIQGAPMDSPVSVVVLYSIAALWAPLIEESMFRGALYHHLRGSFGWIVSAVIVGVIFAAIHPQGWTFIPVLGAIGFNFSVMREWRGSLIAPMVAHGLNNFVMVTLLLVVR